VASGDGAVTGGGLAGPRTALAWHRTALSEGVVAVLLLRDGLTHGHPVEFVAAAFALAAGVAAEVVSRRDPHRGGLAAPPAGAIAVLSVLTVITSVLALLSVLG
jgi:Domain of unknown function (DUF202)